MGCAGSKPDTAPDGPEQQRAGSPAEGKRQDGTGPSRRVAFSSGKALQGATGSLESNHAYPEARKKTDEEIDRLTACTREMMIFANMEEDKKKEIFDSMFLLSCAEDDLVIRQGEIGDVLYVVEEGKFEAYLRSKGDAVQQTYERGGYFGELAMMYNCPRAATIRCARDGQLWGLGRAVYERVMADTVAIKMDSKSQFLRSVEILSQLSEEERSSLSELLEEASFTDGSSLWKAGDPADCLVLVKSGQVEVIEPKKGDQSARVGDGKRLNVGDFFGTQSLTGLREDTCPKRRVGGLARGKVDVYKLHRKAARALGDLPELIVNNSAVKAMRNVEWFKGISVSEKLVAVRSMGKEGFSNGDLIVAKGSLTGQGMHVIVQGSVSVSGGPRNEDGSSSDCVLEVGGHFCSETLLEQQPAPAHYTAIGQVLTVVIDRAALRELADYFMNDPEKLKGSNEAEVRMEDLELLATLGVGGFGRVKLVKNHENGKTYALKCMFKGLVIAKRQTEHILNERRLMGICSHPFLPHLVTTYQDRDQIYVLMDPIMGGELFSLVATRGRLNEDEAAFYCANVTCALEYLHARNIAYRDLKPENLMINGDGYLIVVDFGFAKVVQDRTFTVCGTPEYLAPETIRRAGHGCTVDWWALGVLLYELITGQSPFHGGSQMDVLTRIVVGRVPYDDLLGEKAWGMVTDLLEIDPIRRLGSRVRGRRSVREHNFLAQHLDVDALERREIKAPWVPTIASETDLRNFDNYSDEVEDASEWERFLTLYPDAFIAW